MSNKKVKLTALVLMTLFAMGAEAATVKTRITAGDKVVFGSYWQSFNVERIKEECGSQVLDGNGQVYYNHGNGVDDYKDSTQYKISQLEGNKNLVDYAVKEPIVWTVLEKKNDTATLFSDKILYADAFDTVWCNKEDKDLQEYGNLWHYSELLKTLNGGRGDAGTGTDMYGGGYAYDTKIGFAGDAFSEAEWDVMTPHVCWGEANKRREGPGTSIYRVYIPSVAELEKYFPYDELKDGEGFEPFGGGDNPYTSTGKDKPKIAKLRLLADGTEFANNASIYGNDGVCYPEYLYPNSYCYNHGYWWTRSPLSTTLDNVFYVDSWGNLSFGDVDITDTAGVRPAVDIDSSVKFLSVWGPETGKSLAVTGGGAAKFAQIQDNSIFEITYADNHSSFTKGIEQVDLLALNGAKINVNGSLTGTNDEDTYISVYFRNEGGLVGYGRLADVAKNVKSFAGADMDLSGLDNGDYAVSLVNEYGSGTTFVSPEYEFKGKLSLAEETKNITYSVAAKDLKCNVSLGSTNVLNLTGSGDDNVLSKNVTGAGTTNFIGDVVVDDPVTVAGTVNFISGSALAVNGKKITETAAVKGFSKAGIAGDAKLHVYNAEASKSYRILEGEQIDGGWDKEHITAQARFGLTLDEIANDGKSFNVKFKASGVDAGMTDIGNIVMAGAGGALGAFLDKLTNYFGADTLATANAVNTVVNSGSLAGVSSGAVAMAGTVAGNIVTNVGTSGRGSMMNGGGLRNLASDDRPVQIETIAVGKAKDVMPSEYKEQSYSKEVWASYIHSKQHVDGLKSGSLSNKSTVQYNGMTVGSDLWSGKHSFGGVALTYADVNTHSGQSAASVRNDGECYGISVYNRHDYKNITLLTDVSYTYGSNDVKVVAGGAGDVTSKPKTDTFGFGLRVEQPVRVGQVKITPYAGARYTFLKNRTYSDSAGLTADTDNQNLVSVPVGVSINGEFRMPGSDWTFRPVLEGGYVWNLGDRDGNTKIGYMGAYDIVGFETSDPGQYFIRAAMQFAKADFTCEVGYRYSKGHSVRDNRWNVNLNYAF